MTIKKKILLIPSAHNGKVMGDIINFTKYYKEQFDVYVISDLYQNRKKIEGVNYVNNHDEYSQYLKNTAEYIIDAGTNLPFKVFYNQKRVSVWHGIPYKNMFVDLNPDNYEEALSYSNNADLMISPSKNYTNNFLRNSMLYSREVLETSISRTDELFISDKEKEEIKKELGIEKEKKVLLYAPTFRKEGKFKLPFDPKKIKEHLNGDYVLLIKPHYLNKIKKSSLFIDCTKEKSINRLLAITDLLITDYSSVFFDYSILKKPAIFYQYDKKEYEKDRGFMFKLEDYVEKKYIVQNEENLYKLLNNSKISNNLEKIRKEFYPHQIKNSTSKLVEQLKFDATTRKTKEIIFLVNELNQIGGVHTFVTNLANEFKKKYNSKLIIIGLREFASTNSNNYIFDKDNLFDIKISNEYNPQITKAILENTDGYIISCQYSSYVAMQNYLYNKNAICMFHGDAKDIVSRNVYHWHLDFINNKKIYNYKRLLFLTKNNSDLIKNNSIKSLSSAISYMENGYDFSDKKNYYKENGEFAFISRLDEDKNIFDLIKIFSSKKINSSYKLHVYGDGKLYNEFNEEIKKNKLDSNIILHGYCSDKDAMYKNKQGIIMTSLSEGFPYIILEAAKYGVPIYSYNSFTAAEEMINNSNGKLISTGNIEQYVKVLNKGIKVNKDMNKNIINRFSNEIITKKWFDLFETIDKEKSICSKKGEKTNKKTLRKIIGKIIRKLFFSKGNKIKTDIYVYMLIFKKRVKNIIKHTSKKKQPLVSIIVPFYNNLDTIGALLKSIKHSGYKNYEVLLINDGSNEDPSNISKKYRRIKYYYKKNEGLGLTRNYGIEKANGKYVLFVDSDDTICKYSINFLVEFAEEHKLNLVSGLCRKINFNTKYTDFWYKKTFNKNYINLKKNRRLLLYDTISTAKLYNLTSLKESCIKFEKGLYEDVLFMSEIYDYYDKIGVIRNCVYNWYSYGDNSSITNTITIKNYEERMKRISTIIENSNEKDKHVYLSKLIINDIYIYLYRFNSYTEKERKEIYNSFRNFVIDNKQYLYEKDIKSGAKRELLNITLNNDYQEFLKVALCISSTFYKTRKI